MSSRNALSKDMLSFYDYLFAFTLLSRISDLLTTWLVSPKLMLEANPIVRKFRWPYGFLTLLTAFFAYPMPPVAVALTTTSFLVAASNAMKIASARTLGEEVLYQMQLTQAAKGKFWPGLFYRWAPALFFGMLSSFFFFLFPAGEMWGHWVAFGVLIYTLALLIYGTTSYVRCRRLGLLLMTK